MDRSLTIFINIWVGLFVAVNVMGILAEFYSYGVWGGFLYIKSTYSPFNVMNVIVSIITLSPAIGAWFWRKKGRESVTFQKN